MATPPGATRDERLGVLSERLRKLLSDRGMTQVELAVRSRVDRSYLSSLVNASARSYPKSDTLSKLARALNVEVEELQGRVSLRQATPYERDPDYRRLLDALDRTPEADRAEILRHAIYMAERFQPTVPIIAEPEQSISNVVEFPPVRNGEGDFPPVPVPDESFIERDTDRPRPLHAWVKPVIGEHAAGPARLPDDTVIVPVFDESALVLNSLREVRDERVQIVKVLGRSMEPVLRSGWKVAIDPARTLFRPGKVVLVYLKDEGTSIGVLEETSAGMQLRKVNREYADIPLPNGEWYPMGTVTVVVEAPVEV